jgi:hypothetical protein
MTARPNSLSAPYDFMRTAQHRAPSRTTSENWGRSSGGYGDEDSSTSGYGSVLLYVRKGLGRRDIVEAAVQFARDVQKRAAMRWSIVPLSHGWDGPLKHLGTDVPMRRHPAGSVVEDMIDQTCAMAGDVLDPGRTVVTALFPPTDIRSLYRGKTRVERGDLLVFIDLNEAPLFERGAHEVVQRMRRQVALMSVAPGLDQATWMYPGEFERVGGGSC